ncbi:hypothetical protein AVEN_97032-1 [Araneus ventricosus]|uniref:Uncharacterized protein n=1 Tax=Araneus ventricosus TaxID=182803 RepID=A0A4Y2FFK5_ARAVE|nr:hypothetical protein AVEN_97032-1 [Araneus ventricosus]
MRVDTTAVPVKSEDFPARIQRGASGLSSRSLKVNKFDFVYTQMVLRVPQGYAYHRLGTSALEGSICERLYDIAARELNYTVFSNYKQIPHNCFFSSSLHYGKLKVLLY